MTTYKFLTSGSVGRFSGFRWPPPGAWVEAEGALEQCLHGIHACRLAELPAWIDDELWTIELAGDLVEADGLVVAARGRLLQRVEAWNDGTATAFAEACALRARAQAYRSMRSDGLTLEAEALVSSLELASVQQQAAAVAERSPAAAFAADAIALTRGQRPDAWRDQAAATGDQSPSATAANLAFVTAHSAGREAVEKDGDETAYAAAVAAERVWQVAWLAGCLGLSE